MQTTIKVDRGLPLLVTDLQVLPRIGDKITIGGGTWYHTVTTVIHHIGNDNPDDDEIEVIVG